MHFSDSHIQMSNYIAFSTFAGMFLAFICPIAVFIVYTHNLFRYIAYLIRYTELVEYEWIHINSLTNACAYWLGCDVLFFSLMVAIYLIDYYTYIHGWTVFFVFSLMLILLLGYVLFIGYRFLNSDYMGKSAKVCGCCCEIGELCCLFGRRTLYSTEYNVV